MVVSMMTGKHQERVSTTQSARQQAPRKGFQCQHPNAGRGGDHAACQASFGNIMRGSADDDLQSIEEELSGCRRQ